MQDLNHMQNGKQWIQAHKEKLLWVVFVLLTLALITPRFEATEWIMAPRMLASVIVVVWAVLVRRRLSPIVLLIGLQQGYVLLVTVLQGGDIGLGFTLAAHVGGVVLLYDLMQSERKVFLSSQLFCLEVMIYVNLVTVFRYPGGMYVTTNNIAGAAMGGNYFLGYYNNFSLYCIPALLILSLYRATTPAGKLRKLLLAAAIYVTALKIWSGAVLVLLFAMGIAYLFIRKLPPLFNIYSVWSLHIFFFVGVIWLRLQNLFRWLIEDILGKWRSLTVRLDVWDKTMKLISQAWLFGHGQVDPLLREEKMGYSWAVHAHNLLLELLYQGGIVNLALFILVIVVAGRRVYKYRGTLESRLITIAVFGWCIDSLVEPFMAPLLMAMFVVAYYSNRDALQPGEKDPLDIPKWDEWLRTAPGRLRARLTDG